MFESQSLKKEALQILIKSANQSLNQQLETKLVAALYARVILVVKPVKTAKFLRFSWHGIC